MATIELQCRLQPASETDIQLVIAALNELGYDGFHELDAGVNAYIDASRFDQEALDNLPVHNMLAGKMTSTVVELPDQNWNKLWETHYFQPIILEGKCIVRSEFHKNTPSLPYEIIINPKMSFGTGHHATTRMMLAFLFDIPLANRKVLDMGTGTGILAILSRMKKASQVLAIDIDSWAYRNALENIEINKQTGIEVKQGDSSQVPPKLFDVLLANINRPVLLKDLPLYAQSLVSGGDLVISGFYKEKAGEMKTFAQPLGLAFQYQRTLDDWVAMHFKKD